MGLNNEILRNIAQLANLQAFKLLHEGDAAGAWSWLRAILRSGRHLGMNGRIMDRWYGNDITNTASFQVEVWATDPSVDAQLLRQALDDALAVDAMTAPYRETVRTEFFAYMNILDNARMREQFYAIDPTTGGDRSGEFKNRLAAALAPLRHEPERSRRIMKLHLANWLSVCDLSPIERASRTVKVGKLVFYRPDPDLLPVRSIDELARWTETSRYFGQPGAAEVTSLFCRMMDKDERCRFRPILELTAGLYRREVGTSPRSIDLLIDHYPQETPVGSYLRANSPDYRSSRVAEPLGALR